MGDSGFCLTLFCSIGEGGGTPLQYFCLENPMDGGAWWAACSPWGLEESDTTEWLHFRFSLSYVGDGNGNPLQCSCLENPRDGGAWWAAVYGVTQSQTRLKWLSSFCSMCVCLWITASIGDCKRKARTSLVVQWLKIRLKLPANAGDMGLIPAPGIFHIPWRNEAHILWSLCFVTKEATAMRSSCTTMKTKQSQK